MKLGKNRRLLVILSFLLLDTHSEPDPQVLNAVQDDYLKRIPVSKSKIDNVNSILWLVDSDNGDCLGLHGFGECGDANLWKSHKSSSNLIRFEAIISHLDSSTSHTVSSEQRPYTDRDEDGEHEVETKALCLGRNEWYGIPQNIEPLSCEQMIFKRKLTKWRYDSDTGKIYTSKYNYIMYCTLSTVCYTLILNH